MLNVLGAGLGALEAISGNLPGSKEYNYRKFKEKGVQEAEEQTMSDRERILSLTPVANARMKQMAIQNAGAEGLRVAGNAGGSAANNAMGGGDVSSPALQGAKASQFTGQIANQTGAQLAGTYDAMANEQAQQNQMLMQNTKDKAQIADMVQYVNEGQNGDLFSGILGGAVGGANVLTQIAKLGMPDDEQVESTHADPDKLAAQRLVAQTQIPSLLNPGAGALNNIAVQNAFGPGATRYFNKKKVANLWGGRP